MSEKQIVCPHCSQSFEFQHPASGWRGLLPMDLSEQLELLKVTVKILKEKGGSYPKAEAFLKELEAKSESEAIGG